MLSGHGSTKAISSKAGGLKFKRWWTLALFVPLLFVGAVAFMYLGVDPWMNIYRAKSWPGVECKIISSEVVRNSGKSATYSVDITYQYEANGQAYRGESYDFFSGATSGWENKAAIVEANPPGSFRTCFVNPLDPRDSVIDRDFHPRYLLGLIPLLFAIIGLAGTAWAIKGPGAKPGGKGTMGIPGGVEGAPSQQVPDGGRLVLKPATSPRGRFLFMTGIMLFWNASLSPFLWNVVSGWLNGKGDVVATIFVIPFLAIGALAIGGVGYFFMALFNPMITLTVSGATPRLGESVEVGWSFSGRVSRIRELSIVLEGAEEATYNSGKSTHTQKNVFSTVPIASIISGVEMACGTRPLQMPSGSVPSFDAPHNKIVWRLKVSGSICKWPDVKEEFEVRVLPSKADFSTDLPRVKPPIRRLK